MSEQPELLNVHVTRKAAQALRRTAEMSGINHTDNVSRALVMWAKLTEQVFLPGNKLLVKDVHTGEIYEMTVSAPQPEDDRS